MCRPDRPSGFSFPFLYVDRPPFAVLDRADLWVGACNVCHGVHILRRSSHPCCSNSGCDGAYADAEVIPMTQEEQDVLLSTYILGGDWAVKQLIIGVCEVRT